MSGQQIISDFMQTILKNSQLELGLLQELQEQSGETLDKDRKNQLQTELEYAETNLKVIASINDLFNKNQLTEKRLLDQLKQQRDGE
jgi:hypothetical protein